MCGAKDAAGQNVRGIGRVCGIGGAGNQRIVQHIDPIGFCGGILSDDCGIIHREFAAPCRAGYSPTLSGHAHADGVDAQGARGADRQIHDSGGNFNDPRRHIQLGNCIRIGGHVFPDIPNHHGIPAHIGHDAGLIGHESPGKPLTRPCRGAVALLRCGGRACR